MNPLYQMLSESELKDFGEFFNSEIMLGADNISKLKAELQDFHGSQEPSVSLTNSGASAALVAVCAIACRLRQQNKPLTAFASAFTCPNVFNALIIAGFKVKLIDVEEDGFCLDYERLKRYKHPASLIVISHFMGFACQTWNILEFASYYGSYVLQDAGATYELRERAGGTPQWAYSMTIFDNFNGAGGAILCDATIDGDVDPDYHLCESLISGNTTDIQSRTSSLKLPTDLKISIPNAIYARWQLKHWYKYEQHRKECYHLLFDALKDNENLSVWDFSFRTTNTPTAFPIHLLKDQLTKDLMHLLSNAGIRVRSIVDGLSLPFDLLKKMVRSDNLFNSTAMGQSTFAIELNRNLSAENIKSVVDIIRKSF